MRPLRPRDIFSAAQANRRASDRLVAGFILFTLWLGFGGDLCLYLWTADASYDRVIAGLSPSYIHDVPWLGLVFCFFAVCLCWWSTNYAPVAIMRTAGGFDASEISASDALNDEERRLLNVVEEISVASGLPVPRLWLIPDMAPNALSTGMSPDTACLAVTLGLVRLASRDELQAVVAHEFAHVRSYDVRLMTYLTTLTGFIAFIHQAAGSVLRRRHGTDGNRRGLPVPSRLPAPPPVVVLLFVLWLISWIFAPLVTRLIAMRVSRTREFLADALGSQYTRNPAAMASILDKISKSERVSTAVPENLAHLCFVAPTASRWSDSVSTTADLVSTHPPLFLRIERLRQMAYLA